MLVSADMHAAAALAITDESEDGDVMQSPPSYPQAVTLHASSHMPSDGQLGGQPGAHAAGGGGDAMQSPPS